MVVEIAANHPIEPLPLSPDGLMTRRRWSSSRIASSVARIRFFAVSRSTWKSPFLLVLQQCVNPRKSKVSGLPKVALGQHLIFERVEGRRGPFLSYPPPILSTQVARLPFYFIEAGGRVQRLLANWFLFATCRSKNLRRAWAMQPISVMPCSKLAL